MTGRGRKIGVAILRREIGAHAEEPGLLPLERGLRPLLRDPQLRARLQGSHVYKNILHLAHFYKLFIFGSVGHFT